MIVEPGGRRCGCGRVGCWETVSGLRALLDAAADPDDPVRDPALSLEDRLAEINRRADLGDTRTLAALDQVGGWVGIGAAMLANALNPAAIVLSGYFAEVGHHMRPAIEEHLLARGARAARRRHPRRVLDPRLHRRGPRRRVRRPRVRLRRPDRRRAPPRAAVATGGAR